MVSICSFYHSPEYAGGFVCITMRKLDPALPVFDQLIERFPGYFISAFGTWYKAPVAMYAFLLCCKGSDIVYIHAIIKEPLYTAFGIAKKPASLICICSQGISCFLSPLGLCQFDLLIDHNLAFSFMSFKIASSSSIEFMAVSQIG